MKKIIMLCLMLASVVTAKAQDQNSVDQNSDLQEVEKGGKKKNKKVKQEKQNVAPKLEYLSIQEILDNANNLKLTTYQVSALNIKNEYIKRDLQKLNANALMPLSEKEIILRDLSISYDLFIQKILKPEQQKELKILQAENAITPEYDKSSLRVALHEIDKDYKEEVKEIKRKYKGNKSVYYAQRNLAKKRYEFNRVTTIEFFQNLGKDQGDEQDNYVMTLEEISNIYKAYDDYYSQEKQSNPLDFLEIKEEYPANEEYLDVYPDEIPGNQQYNEEGDF
ncbi:hypothetical protein ACYSNX_01280 [Myroides sp. LJL115]